jgi:hypothetical protein
LEQSLAALAAGKQVICEKLLVGSLADGDPVDRHRAVSYRSAASGLPIPLRTAWTRRAAYYTVPWRRKYETELGGIQFRTL